MKDADVVVFGGGADIDPATYNEERSKGTYTNATREAGEKRDFHEALKRGIKMVGICRGHQFLVAMAGGKLIQDVTNHHGHHATTTYDGLEINCNSIHHQMVNPYEMNPKKYKILAWSTQKLSDYYLGGANKRILLPLQFKEIESIYLPEINALGFQYHPEMMYGRQTRNAAIDWTQNTFIKFFEGKL
jgi:putative glutamine amidotransferase